METVTIGQAVQAYWAHEQTRGLALTTVRSKKNLLMRFLEFCRTRHISDPTQITVRKMEGFLSYLSRCSRRSHRFRRGPLSWSARYSIVREVHALLKFLVTTGELLVNPAADLELPPPQPGLPQCVAPDQMDALVDLIDTSGPVGLRDRAILEVFYGCGLRLRELVGLDLYDVDLAGGVVMVRRGKGGRSRLVPIAGEAHEALVSYLERGRPELVRWRSESALFLGVGGRRLCSGGVYCRVKLIAQSAGDPRAVTPHAFRHGYATAMVRAGADVTSVQKMLGHRRLDTTQRYTHLVIDDLRRVHRRTHPRGRRS